MEKIITAAADSHRTFTTADAQFKVLPARIGSDSIGTLEGYALVWNVVSSDRGGYRVRLMPGSAQFAPEVRALWHHEGKSPLGTTVNGTLRLRPDAFGVHVEIDLPPTASAQELLVLVKRRDIRGMSFGMTDTPEGERVTENGGPVLNARRYFVDEVTVTSLPAFIETTIDAKSQPSDSKPDYRQQAQAEILRFRLITLPPANQPPRRV